MLIEVDKILTILTVFLFALFSLYLLTSKEGNRLSNFLLAAFLLAKSFDIFENILIYYQYQGIRHYHLRLWGFPFFFLYLPLLYFYVRSITNSGFKLKWIHAVHAVPFAAVFLFVLLNYHLHSIDAKKILLEKNIFFNAGLFNWNLLLGYHNAQFVAYMAASLMHVHHYKIKIKSYFSTIDRIKLSWLNYVLIMFIIVKSFDLINHLLMIFNARALLPPYIVLREGGVLVFACIIFIKSIKQPKIFFSEDFHSFDPKYKTSPLTSEYKQRYLKKIEETMRQEKLFLNPQLSLKDLSRQTSIPPQYISQILNESMNKHFFDYVNSFRIEAAKNILQHAEVSPRTVLEVCYKVGFNAKSTFNRIFKKHTNMTPTEFRNHHHPFA